MSFTKGPWEVSVEVRSRYDSMTGEPREDKSTWVKAGKKSVAVVCDYGVNAEANARLMAAAPDLLEAADQALTLIMSLRAYQDQCDQVSDVCAGLEEAILKTKCVEAVSV